MYFHYFKFVLCSSFINVFATVLNIDELNSIHYSIDIVNNPVLKNKEWSTDIVTVTNKHGQEYVCTLPEVQIPENENKKEEDLLDQLVDISELLKPMEAAPCLVKKKDWWFYEFCYGSIIKQYHLEDNKVVGTILILGKYESEYNWRNNSKSKNKLQKFHTQNYVNGSRCDLTGEPRRAEVRFHCEEGVGDYIQQVDEPESCRYVIIIATTRVCHHPYLKPNPNTTPHNINCAPALTQPEFEHYQKLQEIKKLKSERELLKLQEKMYGSDLGPNGDPTNAVGETETDEDTKWSIQLVTIPISKKSRTGNIQSEINSAISGQPLAVDTPVVPSDLSEASAVPTPDVAAPANLRPEAGGAILPPDLLDIPIGKSEEEERKLFGRDLGEEKEEDYDDEEEETATEDAAKQGEKGEEDAEKQFKAFRSRMDRLMKKWMEEVQNENHIKELLHNIKLSLDENVKKVEEKSPTKFTEEALPSYFRDLMDMAEKYTKKLPEMENLNADDIGKLMDTLASLTEILSEAELQVLEALRKKKKMDRMEKYLESQIDELGTLLVKKPTVEPEGGAAAAAFLPEDDTPSPASPSADTPKTPEDPLEPSGVDAPPAEKEPTEGTEEKAKADTRHVRIVNGKTMEEGRKFKLERSIKERLQKSGLDNIGRKIEVKILTPKYFEDDEKDSLSSLSQEETEAFHNMIVNILSASAEEMRERERHKSLEFNYDFHLEDEASGEEEEGASEPAQGEAATESAEATPEPALHNSIINDFLNDIN